MIGGAGRKSGAQRRNPGSGGNNRRPERRGGQGGAGAVLAFLVATDLVTFGLIAIGSIGRQRVEVMTSDVEHGTAFIMMKKQNAGTMMGLIRVGSHTWQSYRHQHLEHKSQQHQKVKSRV